MAKVEIPYVQAFRDRHGGWRHYYRRRGFPRAALPGVPGSREFMDTYERAGREPEPQAEAAKPRTINFLIQEYYRSGDWRDLKDSTRVTYRNHLDRFRAKYGDRSAVSIETKHLEAIFHGMAATPGAATNLRKRLRRVFKLAVRLGWRRDNPVTETEIRRRKSEGFTPWSEADIAQYEAHWPSGSKERLAMAMLLYTGQRRSDVVGMGRQHIAVGKISVRQLKTDARVTIPLHPALAHEIDSSGGELTLLLTMHGKPYSAAGFTSWFRERAEMAGLPNRTPHGLRKAAGRRLAEAGCTAKEIAAILGHSSLSEVARYTRDADQERLADGAMDKLRAAETRTGRVKPQVSNLK